MFGVQSSEFGVREVRSIVITGYGVNCESDQSSELDTGRIT